MAQAARLADDDAGGGLLSRIDSLQVVNVISWPYPDAPGLLASLIGAEPTDSLYSAVGGETPQRLVNATAEAIVAGRTRVALITGAEAMQSRRLARKEGARLQWAPRGAPEQMIGDTRNGFSDVEALHGAVLPTRVYPLFENAIRADAGRTIEEHQAHLGRLGRAPDGSRRRQPLRLVPGEANAGRDRDRATGQPLGRLSVSEADERDHAGGPGRSSPPDRERDGA